MSNDGIQLDPMRVAKHLEAKVGEIHTQLGQSQTQNAILNAALEQAQEEIAQLVEQNRNLETQLQEFRTGCDTPEGNGLSTPSSYADAITPHGPGVETPYNNQEDGPKFSDSSGEPHRHDDKGNHI